MSCTPHTQKTFFILKYVTMEANYDKLDFGRELSLMGGDVNNHGDCFHYGVVAGCDSGCPCLLRGGCDVFEDVVSSGCLDDMEETDFSDLNKLYDNQKG